MYIYTVYNTHTVYNHSDLDFYRAGNDKACHRTNHIIN